MKEFFNVKVVRRLCLVIVIIILILISYLIIVTANKQNGKNNDSNMEWTPSGKNFEGLTPSPVDESKVINEDVKITKNGYWFFNKYVKGDYSSKELHEQIYYFLNNSLTKYSKELNKLDEKQLEDYYNKNREKIAKDCIRVTNYKEFVNFTKVICKIDENAEVQYSKFDTDNIEQKEDCTIAKIDVEYTDGTKISLYIKVFLRKTNNNEFFEFTMQ